MKAESQAYADSCWISLPKQTIGAYMCHPKWLMTIPILLPDFSCFYFVVYINHGVDALFPIVQ